jgi:2-polyprenyl-6-methoxyphenol hydroxylase-like FAD-dependent oxidoreductase
MAAAHNVLVIGGGIAGLVAALALRRAGIQATLYEAHPMTGEGLGGMLMVAPNGLEALRLVGADVSTIGQPLRRMVMGDGSGKTFGEFAGLPHLPPSQLLWRADLWQLLRERTASQQLHIEYGKRLVSVDHPSSGVTARFADGSSAQGDVLVGADGIRSEVRRLIDPSAPGPKYVGFIGFGGYLPRSPIGGKTDAMHFVFGKRAFLGYWSAPDGALGWFSNLPRTEPLTMAQTRAIPASEWLRQLREAFTDEVPGQQLLEQTTADQLLSFGAGEILPSVARWHRARMVLVGDSAHAPSSSSGQGASMAIESAIQLAKCLRDIPDLSAAFSVYEQLRRPRVERVAAFGARQNNNKTKGPLAKALMSLLMPIAMKTVLTPQKMFGWMHDYRIEWDTREAA